MEILLISREENHCHSVEISLSKPSPCRLKYVTILFRVSITFKAVHQNQDTVNLVITVTIRTKGVILEVVNNS